MTALQPPLPLSSSHDQRVGCRRSASLRVALGQLRGVVAAIGILLVLAAGALVFSASPASALTVDQVETRVAAINVQIGPTVEVDRLLPPRSPPVSAGSCDDVALGCCVAPRTAVLDDDFPGCRRTRPTGETG